MRALFIMDPLDFIDIHHDSTFAIMLETQARGHEVLYCLVTDLSLRQGVPEATVRDAKVQSVQGAHAAYGEPFRQPLRELDLIFMRKDPPFDIEYIFATYILEAAEPHAAVVNRPASLRSHNEKLYALQFPEFCPETLVSGDVVAIRAFQAELGTAVVVKPLDGNGGEGIFVVRAGDANLNVIVELSTRKGRRPVMVQRYLPEAREGDKRILLVDGQFVGAVLRVPSGPDPRGNMVRGAVAQQTTLTSRERLLIESMGPRLVADGHLFVGLDVIGEHLTEVNVTSPTGIHEINRLDNTRVETHIVTAMERASSARGRV